MWKCSVCHYDGNKEKKMVCDVCGYTRTIEYIIHRTVSLVPPIEYWDRKNAELQYAYEKEKDAHNLELIRLNREYNQMFGKVQNLKKEHKVIMEKVQNLKKEYEDALEKKKIAEQQKEVQQKEVQQKEVQQKEVQGLDGIPAYLKKALTVWPMGYENVDIQELQNIFRTQGFDIRYSTANYYYQKENSFHRDFSVTFSTDSSNEISCYDCYRYKNDIDFQRELTFKISLSWLLFSENAAENANSKWLSNGIIPLPCGIRFGDSVHKVLEKLGIKNKVGHIDKGHREFWIGSILVGIDRAEENNHITLALTMKRYSCQFRFLNRKMLLSTYWICIKKREQ